jgi:hypothetical protein
MKLPELERIKLALSRSLNRLIENDGMLFEAPVEKHAPYDERKLHEVCINHKLAEYLAAEILPILETKERLFVDMEFNREGIDFKNVKIEDKVERVRPDIIVHNRRSGRGKLNLLIVECKKSGSHPAEIAHDCKKIIALMSDVRYLYDFGLQVIYDASQIAATLFYKEGSNIRTVELTL